MVDGFNMDMNVGGDAKPPFFAINFKKRADDERVFIVTKKIDVVRSTNNGLLDVVGFWSDRTEDYTDLEGKQIR